MNQKSTACVFFSIVAKNYMAYARTLCQSIASHHPNAKIFIALSDCYEETDILPQDNVEFITVDQLGLPDTECFMFRYDVMEFSTAIKPYVFRWIFEQYAPNMVIYLDPDILVLSPLLKVINLLEKGATGVLTPHLTMPVNDGFKPDERTMLQAGVYNLGFIGLSHQPEARCLVDWWCQRLEKHAIVDLEQGLFTDQKWADLMPCLFEGVEILRSPAYNIAYWNLMQRKVTKEQDTWLVDQELISFVHFSGINPKKPALFSKHQNRFSQNNIGAIEEVYNNYLALLEKNSYEKTINIPYGFGVLSDGTKIHPAMRVYFRSFLDTQHYTIDQPLSTLTAAYFNTIEKKLPNNIFVTRFMYGFFLSQRKNQVISQLDTTESQRAFAFWFSSLSPTEHQIDKIFLAHAYKLLNTQIEKNKTIQTAIKIYLAKFISNVYGLSPTLFKCSTKFFPKKIIEKIKLYSSYRHNDKTSIKLRTKNFRALISRRVIRLFTRLAPATEDHSNPTSSNQAIERNLLTGLTLIGYVFGDFGIAQNLRGVANAFISVKYPIDIIALSTPEHSESDTSLDHLVVDESKNLLQLYCINADNMISASDTLLLDAKHHSAYRIGYWFWELAKFPKEWLSAFDLVDEIWAPSHFIFDMLSPISSKPVIYVPVAVSANIEKHYGRGYFGLPEKKILFLCYYDFHSFMHRKNPEGAIKAFLEAFPDKENAVELIIKTINGAKHPQQYIELLEMAQTDRRIHVINKTMLRNEMLNLINNCDSLVSLHRAEGFGLGLAEAMLLGKPVIATGYSGNMDFMNSENSCVVDYNLIPVEEDYYPFWPGQHWAEPDCQQAAMYMKKLYEDVEYRQNIAEKGQAWIREKHSPTKVGEIMRDRLNEISKI